MNLHLLRDGGGMLTDRDLGQTRGQRPAKQQQYAAHTMPAEYSMPAK